MRLGVLNFNPSSLLIYWEKLDWYSKDFLSDDRKQVRLGVSWQEEHTIEGAQRIQQLEIHPSRESYPNIQEHWGYWWSSYFWNCEIYTIRPLIS